MMDNEEQKVNTQREKAVFHSRRTRMRTGENRYAQEKKEPILKLKINYVLKKNDFHLPPFKNDLWLDLFFNNKQIYFENSVSHL